MDNVAYVSGKLKAIWEALTSVYSLMLMIWTFIFYQTLQVFVLQRELPAYVYEEKLAETKISRQGAIVIETKLIRDRPCSVTVTRFITDAVEVRFELLTTTLEIETVGYEQYSYQFAMPRLAALGPASITLISRYTCHWSHHWWPMLSPTRVHTFTIVE